MTQPETEIVLPWKLNIAGHTKCLYVDSFWSRCGEIKDGIGLSFCSLDGKQWEGGWVIDYHDLKRLVAAVEAFREQRGPWPEEAA